MDEFKTIHSHEHMLAKDISEWCNEKKLFTKYLGVIKRIGKDRAYQIWSELKQIKDIRTPGKLFMYKSKRI